MKKYLPKSIYGKALFLGFLTAFCLFIPFIAADKGFFLYAGDFNSQQIPFYMYVNRLVKSGNLNWGWAVDLGSSVINSFSFYLLGSPFFWLSCLFPYKAVPYIMPWLLMLKFAVGNLGAFLYLRRYAKNDNYAMAGAILYTFSGFSIYNIFFNHFIESVVFFPFLLWALDEFIYKNKKGIFPLFVALNLVNNYFFFVGQVIFLFIYFFVKILTGEYKVKINRFLNLAFEALLGCFMGMILFIPSAVSVMENPRVTSGLSGFGIWLYGNVQQYFAILTSALLPPDPPYIPALFTSATIKWTSMSLFMAMGGLAGFFVFSKYRKNSAFYKTFCVCALCAFVPVLNSMFYAFNSAYYARWYYMPLLMLAAMNMQAFAMEKEEIFHGFKITALLTACLLVFGITPVKGDNGITFGLADEKAVYRVNMLIAFFSLYVAYVIVSNFNGKPGYTQKLMTGTLCITMLYGVIHLGLTKLPQFNADKHYKPQNYDVIDNFDAFLQNEELNRRIDTFNCYYNLSMFTGVPCLQYFNSTVTPSIMDFYPAVGVKRDVNSLPGHNLYPLRSLLSVKYILMPNWEEESFLKEASHKGYEKISEEYPYTVYKNNNFINIGFTYDKYVTYEDLDNVVAINRSNILMRAVAVDREVLDKYGLDLQPLEDYSLYDYSYETFTVDVTNRQRSQSSEFVMTKDGFECKITPDKNNLVFFRVPYDEGFTATVNGKEREIIKVNYGLCAVYAPEGENEIIFTYRTPGLYTGVTITAAGRAVWSVYFYKCKKEEKK